MSTKRREPGKGHLPSPFPEGWYFVASRQEILKAGILAKTWLGKNIVAWCDESVCVAEAYCPHLGSYLGPEAGACLRGGRLVCPFHGFQYDTTGQCVATPYADPPKTARLQTFETKEIAGLIFAWWGIGGRPPQWTLPAEHVEQAGWSSIRVRTMRFPGHPQDTTENSVDLGHLRYVHGYDSVNRVGRILVDGPYLESGLRLQECPEDCQGGNFYHGCLRQDPHIWPGLLFRPYPRAFHRNGPEALGARHPRRWHTHRSIPRFPGQGDTQPQAMGHGVGFPPNKVPCSVDEPVRVGPAGQRRSAGHSHLES